MGTDTFPNTASNPAAYAATNTTCYTWRTSGSIQLRCRCREYVGSGQKSMVLQDSSPRVPTDRSPATGHSSTSAAADLSASAAYCSASAAADCASEACGALQLRCRLGQLDGRMVNPEKELVLLKQGQGLPACSWRMCLRFLIRSFLAVALVLGTIFWCCWQVLFASKAEEYRCSDLAGMAWRGSSAGASAIFWLWS